MSPYISIIFCYCFKFKKIKLELEDKIQQFCLWKEEKLLKYLMLTFFSISTSAECQEFGQKLKPKIKDTLKQFYLQKQNHNNDNFLLNN